MVCRNRREKLGVVPQRACDVGQLRLSLGGLGLAFAVAIRRRPLQLLRHAVIVRPCWPALRTSVRFACQVTVHLVPSSIRQCPTLHGQQVPPFFADRKLPLNMVKLLSSMCLPSFLFREQLCDLLGGPLPPPPLPLAGLASTGPPPPQALTWA